MMPNSTPGRRCFRELLLRRSTWRFALHCRLVQQTLQGPPPTGRPPAGSQLRRVRFTVALVLLLELVALVVAIGATGGFRTAPPKPLPRAEVGQPVSNGRFEFRVLRAVVATKNPRQNPQYAEAGRFLVLEMDLRLTVKESLQYGSDIQSCLRLRFDNGYVIDGDASKSLDQRAGTMLPDRGNVSLHPGMPERVLAIYELPASQPFPSELDVVIYRVEYREGFFDKSRSWRVAIDDPEIATIRMPVSRGAG
jgi:hypothetical protein